MNTQNQTLVRLTANSLDSIGKQAIFEGTFNDGILIKPNSQVALHSCSLSRDQDVLLINSSNNKITFQISATGGLHEVFLANGTYDADTLVSLLNHVQDSMNDKLDILKSKEHNSFIEVKVTSQNKVDFNFMRGERKSLLINPITNDPIVSGLHYSKNNGQLEVLRKGAGTSQYLTGTANYTPIAGTRQYIYSSDSFAQGAGDIKARIDRFVVTSGDQVGEIATATITQAGTGYAAGDTGTLSANNPSNGDGGTYRVDTVNAAGNILTFTITYGGIRYNIGDEVALFNNGDDNAIITVASLAPPPAGKKSGCIIGLLPDTPEINNTLTSQNSSHKILEKDYVYAVCTNTDGDPTSPYMIKTPETNGVFVSTGIVPFFPGDNVINNDIISIRMNEGNIELVVAKTEPGVLPEIPLFIGRLQRRDIHGNIIRLVPYVGIFGSDNQTRLGNVTIDTTPTDGAVPLNSLTEEVLSVGQSPFPSPNGRPTIFNLIFEKEEIQFFLGFENREQNAGGIKTAVARYTAENTVTKLFSTNTYLVEMLSEQLDSYDSFDGGRKNILSPIPLSENVVSSTGIIHFVPSNLVFINLRNEREKLVRNMRLRIVTNSYEPIRLEGIADMTLLIRSN